MRAPSVKSTEGINPEGWIANYGQTLFRYTVSKVRNLDLAEDILQETYASAMGSLQHFKGGCSEKTWLVAILKHKISDHFRSIQRNYRLNAAVCSNQISACVSFTGQTEYCDPYTEYESKELLDTIHCALSKLPSNMALVFFLYEIEGMPSDRICRYMNIKVDNFYVMLFRARRRIRKYLQIKWLNA